MNKIAAMRHQVESLIREVPNHPKPNILFKDIMPLLRDPIAFRAAQTLQEQLVADCSVDKVVGIESRGFLFGVPIAQTFVAGFVAARKPGKLPGAVVAQQYELEYGHDTLVIQADAICPGDSVVVVDDLLATGGTMEAACQLVETMGGVVVSCLCLIELGYLGARSGKLAGRRIDSVFMY